jgi:hypothetical protein
MLFGRINSRRKLAIEHSRNYMEAYLKLMETFHSEDEELFPANVRGV